MSLATERRAARERALGLLYEAEAKGLPGADILADLPIAADDFAVALVTAVDDHQAEIDALLTRFAQGWTLARMPALDRAALRMGTAELLTRSDVPTGVVLSEVVELASRFSTDSSGRFVNGLLARIAEEVRPASATGLGAGPAGAGSPPEEDEAPLAPLVEGLIIDLDGVIRHWDVAHTAATEARLGIPEGALLDAAFRDGRLSRVIDGRLSFEGWCEEIGAVLAAEHGISAAEAGEAFAMQTWQIDLDVLDLVAAARELVPVALLSNASTHLRVDVDASGITDAFDAVVGSADIGVAKPAPAAFRAAADAIGVPVDRCAFVDDTRENVEGAASLGMRAAAFTDVDGLRAFLVDLQLVR